MFFLRGNKADTGNEPSDKEKVELMTFKDYMALLLALLYLLLPWVLISSGIYALLIFLLTKFWLK